MEEVVKRDPPRGLVSCGENEKGLSRDPQAHRPARAPSHHILTIRPAEGPGGTAAVLFVMCHHSPGRGL